MALWGNNDNVSVASDGTVTLDYDTKEVIGTGTTFGNSTVGSAKTGDVIRFGFRDATAGVGTYFGDAVIVGIASTTSLTIGSTIGLSGVAIADTSFTVAELPKSSVLDVSYSDDADYNHAIHSFNTIFTGGATDDTGIGVSVVATSIAEITFGGVDTNTQLLNDGNTIPIVSIGTANFHAEQGSAIGFSTVFVSHVPGLAVGNELLLNSVNNSTDQTIIINSIGSTSIGLASTLPEAISADEILTFRGDFLQLQSVVSAGIDTGDSLTFQRLTGGYDKFVYGVSGAGVTQAQETKFAVSHGGWVGILTYHDNHGNLRVKSETLVAMSGIETGNRPTFPGQK